MSLSILAAAFVLVFSQEKVEFKYQPKEGDKFESRMKMSMSLKATVKAGEMTQEIESEQVQSKKKLTEFTSVKDGKVVKGVVDTQEDWTEVKQPGMEEPTRTEGPLSGRKVSFEVKGGDVVVDGAEGLDENTRKGLQGEDQFTKLLTKADAKVGESWEVSGEALQKAMSDKQFSDGKVTFKLKEIREIEKRRCAILSADFDLSGKQGNGMEMSMKMQAETVYWIDRGYVLSVKGEGKLSMKGGNEQMQVDGEGPITLEMTTTVK